MSWFSGVVWLALLILFLVAEAATVGLVSIWFGAGSLAALISSFFIENIWVQIAIFLTVSALALAGVRPVVRRYFRPRQLHTNADRVIGQEAVITETIDAQQSSGAVKVGGLEWSACAESASPLPVGEVVTVLRIEGVKLVVAPACQREEECSHV